MPDKESHGIQPGAWVIESVALCLSIEEMPTRIFGPVFRQVAATCQLQGMAFVLAIDPQFIRPALAPLCSQARVLYSGLASMAVKDAAPSCPTRLYRSGQVDSLAMPRRYYLGFWLGSSVATSVPGIDTLHQSPSDA